MCGIVGIASEFLSDKDKQIFSELLACNVLRGWNATGVVSIRKDYMKGPIITYYKKALPSQWMLTSKAYIEMLKEHQVKVLIGHCRARTIGADTDANAHPFTFKNVIGVHNGTLRYWAKGYEKFDTDSEALYSNISDNGIEKAIEGTKGAYALCYWDKLEQSLNFLRNKERPLYIAGEEYGRTIYWASEPGLLHWILARNNIKVERIVPLRPDLLVKFKPLEDNFTQKMKVFEVAQKEAVTVYDNSAGFSKEEEEAFEEALLTGKFRGASNRNRVTVSSAENGSVRAIGVRKSITDNTLDPKIEGWKGYKNRFIPRNEFIELMNEGCIYCSKVSLPNAPKRWVNESTYLCTECKESNCFEHNVKFVERDTKIAVSLH